MPFFSNKQWQFTYFSQQVGEASWSGKNVLDFGGNIGNILRDPNSTIDEERYWCLDVARESIERGRTSFPKAHWIFYNRYCFFFNPRGVPHLPIPELNRRFDYIVAFSVFTNTPRTDMLELVDQLEDRLSMDGVLAFTFIEPNYFSWPMHYHGNNFQWRLEQEVERGDLSLAESLVLLKSVHRARWFMLVNGNDLYVETEEMRPIEPERQKSCYVFYSENYMKMLFPHATILPPVKDEMQHCCVIRRKP